VKAARLWRIFRKSVFENAGKGIGLPVECVRLSL
jgi:hypothetical protein